MDFGILSPEKYLVYDFSVEYSSIDESDILNFRKYLMTMKNIK